MGMLTPIVGSGGGRKGDTNNSGGTRNTLRSKARARLVDLIGEGEMEAVLVSGAKSIYFDETPVQDDETDAINFEGVTFDTRSGLPDQDALKGIASVETPVAVDVRVKKSASAPVRTITDEDADAVRVIMRIPALVKTDRENGKLEATSVSYAIDVRPSGGDWTEVVLQNIEDEKTTSPYEKAHRFDLPEGGNPWDIRVRRITNDSEEAELQNETWWASYFVITEGRFIYPNSAVISLEVDAELFGNSLPARFYHVKGLKVQVPSNYNPVTRVYTGIWNGTFLTKWTNNPAWILYDLLTNDRYGLGEHIDVASIDKWALYQIGRYCDEMIPSGVKDDENEDILEPRYTFNGVINNRAEAFVVLRQVAAAFRGMAYWSLNQVTAIADMPADPVKIVSPANVNKGFISYAGSARRARHSVALVQWNDPDNFDRPEIEVYIDDESLKQFGWREIPIQAVGCRSRGQARRLGKWALFTEKYETEIATYEASWDHADVRPGQVIAIADPAKAEVRAGGRLYEVDGDTITLDAPFEPADGEVYSLMAQLPDGTIETKAITWVEDPGEGLENRVVELGAPFSESPLKGAMWAITGTDIEPRLFRVLSVVESEPHLFKITAAQHHPEKYDLIEQNLDLPAIPYVRPRNGLLEPNNVTTTEALYFAEGSARSRLTLSWASVADFVTSHYHVTAQTPHGPLDLGPVNGLSIDIPDVIPGIWRFFIQAIGVSGLRSRVAEHEVEALGWEGVPAPYVSHVEAFEAANGAVFGGRNCRINWRNNFPGSSYDWGTEPAGAGSGNVNPFYRDNVVRVYDPDTNDLLRTDIVQLETYTYTYEHNVEDNELLGQGPLRRLRFEVTIRDNVGRESSPVSITLENPVPAQLDATVTAGLDTIHISYELPADIDFVGALVWMSDTPGIDPDVDVPFYQGPANSITIPVEPFNVYFVRIAGYDAFGTQDLNVSDEVSALPESAELDTTPPAVPTNVVTAAEIVRQDDGTLQSVLTALWDASSSTNFAYFEVEIREQGGNYISFTTTTPLYEWRGLLFNTTYELRVRAVSRNGYPSAYTSVEDQLVPANTVAPGAPSSVGGLASVRSVFLAWTNPTDSDLGVIEIWSSLTNDRNAATLVGTSRSSAFTHSGLTTGVTRYYWLRAVNTSGIQGSFSAGTTSGYAITPGEVDTDDIAADAITAEKILAGEITGDHISVTADLAATITIDGTGISLGDMTDPADLVNANATVIQPGKIQISGATTLADWRNGTDATKIEGGSIAANTVSANKLYIGIRGVDIAGLQFEPNSPTSNKVAWSAGTINYTDDAGATASAAISASNATWSSGTLFVYWVKGATALSTSTTRPTGADDIVLATYRGGVDLVVNYGRTIIDGSHIIAGTVTASQIAAGTITATQIASGTITATQIAALAITTAKIAAGAVTANELAVNSITAVKITAGAIETAKIAVGGVETDRVAANAITNLVSALTTGTIDTNDSSVMKEVQSLTITRTAGTSLDMDFGYDMSAYILNAPLKGYLYLEANGSLIFSINLNSPLCEITGFDSFGGPVSWNYTDTANRSGSVTYSLQLRFYHDGSDYDPVTVRNRYIKGVEFKR